jgi:hypothetical protein
VQCCACPWISLRRFKSRAEHLHVPSSMRNLFAPNGTTMNTDTFGLNVYMDAYSFALTAQTSGPAAIMPKARRQGAYRTRLSILIYS